MYTGILHKTYICLSVYIVYLCICPTIYMPMNTYLYVCITHTSIYFNPIFCFVKNQNLLFECDKIYLI